MKTDTLIALAGFYNVNEKHASAMMALYFESEYRDKATFIEAMRVVIDFGYTQVGLNRIDFYLYPLINL